MAKDSDILDPPRNLTLNYRYYATTPEAVLTWNAPFSAALTDVTGFQVYRKVGAGQFSPLGSLVEFISLGDLYSYTDIDLSHIDLGIVVSYYVKSIRDDPWAESNASTTVSLTIIEPSSAPQSASAVGLQVEFSGYLQQDVTTTFANPSSVQGGTYGAYFTVQIIDINDPLDPLPVAENTVPYESESGGYSFTFENIPFATNSTGVLGSYRANIWLNTTTIIGVAAIVDFVSGPRPIISLVNGASDKWSLDDPLTTFTVTTSSLAPLVDVFIVYRRRSDNTIEIDRPTYPPPTAVDLHGNYTYTFNSIHNFRPSITHLALTISAANQFGNGIRHITGPIIEPP
jgi:hypothetical protein